MTELLIVAGDPSGDFHGANLIRALKSQNSALHVTAVGGRLMQAAADAFLFDLAGLGITGFIEPLRQIPRFLSLLRSLRCTMRDRHPTVVCIDYYGLNRWVLALAKRQGLKTFYYISPQVWASRPGRARVLKRLVDQMLVIFPFEEEFYRRAQIPAKFVGHPFVDAVPEPTPANSHQGIRLGLLPGSRPSELRRHLPIFLETYQRLKSRWQNVEGFVFAAAPLPDALYAPATRMGLKLVRETNYAQRAQMDLVITSSGTATLENALLGLPMVVVYRLSWPTYLIARSLVDVPYISMANLLAGRALVPELIQHHATAEKITRAASEILGNPAQMMHLRKDLTALRQTLGTPGSSTRAAQIILAA